jgi:hypothetical protein
MNGALSALRQSAPFEDPLAPSRLRLSLRGRALLLRYVSAGSHRDDRLADLSRMGRDQSAAPRVFSLSG